MLHIRSICPFQALIIETLHSIGVCIFVLVLLPNIEPLSGVLLCCCVALVPGIIKIIYPSRIPRLDDSQKMVAARAINFFAMLFQLAAIALWCYYVFDTDKSDGFNDTRTYVMTVLVAISPILVSINWWENYVRNGDKESKGLPKLKRGMRRRRTKVTAITSVWKLIMTLIIMPSAIYGIGCAQGTECVRSFFFQNRGQTTSLSDWFTSAVMADERNFGNQCISWFPFVISILNIICSVVCFKAGKAACKIVAQRVSFSFPLALSTPIVIGFVLGLYSGTATFQVNGCTLLYPTWINDNGDPTELFDVISDYWMVLAAGLLGYMSFLLITNHVWSPSKERLVSTDK